MESAQAALNRAELTFNIVESKLDKIRRELATLNRPLFNSINYNNLTINMLNRQLTVTKNDLTDTNKNVSLVKEATEAVHTEVPKLDQLMREIRNLATSVNIQLP